MAERTVYGNTHSENGWPMVDEGSCQLVQVPGANVTLQIQQGQPIQILRAFAADYHAFVEPLRDPDSACWASTNSVASSNHLSGTACDLNWDSHPFHAWGTFNPGQMGTVRELLKFYEDTVFWGGDWQSTIDEMHWQMGYNTYGNPATQRFIDTKIRPDGYSTFQRSETPDPVMVLADAMRNGVSLDRYRQLFPAVQKCLTDCSCMTVERVAMWCAQIGHESSGLKYMEEIASGAAYDGRADLGNTQPGDGVRFKGRGPIQVTGRHNYTELSKWAYGKGLVPSPTFFVDQPTQLASDAYGFVGVTWYWSTQRPMNVAADAKDIEQATRYVNGGLNGIDDRRARYRHALDMGDALLSLTRTVESGDRFMPALSDAEQRELLDLARQTAGYRRKSLSPLRWPGEGPINTCAGFAWTADANAHVIFVERLAVQYGDPTAIALLSSVATMNDPTRQHDSELAARILSKVPQEYLTAAGVQASKWLAAEADAS